MMTGLRDVSFADLLPGSVAGSPDIHAAARALDNELKQVRRDMDKVLVYHRLDDLEGDVLNLLAWQFNVDFFDMDLPDTQKRECIRESIAWHKKKGTQWAVETALANAGYNARIITFREARQILEAQGGARLDGTWALDSTQQLEAFSNVSGAAWMEHWAQFCVKMDLLSTVRPGWEKEVRSIVETAKNQRSHPVYLYFMDLSVDMPVFTESRGSGAKITDCLPLACAVQVDGSWELGRDAQTLRVDGAWQLKGGIALGRILMPAHADQQIYNCRLSCRAGGGGTTMARAGEPADGTGTPWFRLERQMRQVDGTWELGADFRLDGTWCLETGPKLKGPGLGWVASHTLNNTLKIGHQSPESDTWPQISGGVYGSGSIN